MATVYISHRSSIDDRLAAEVRNQLRELQHNALIAQDIVRAGSEWRFVLRNALKRSDAVIALLTKDGLESTFVISEIATARALEKRLIPVVSDYSSVPFVVSDLHCLSLSAYESIKDLAVEIDKALKEIPNNRVFIVHGHDEAKRRELETIVGQLGLEPIVLVDQDSKGLSLIEKFEYYGKTSSFAFVLLTPDDRQVHNGTQEERWRARQNVILELGWMMAALGRERVMLIHRGDIEIPSDLLGIVSERFQSNVAELKDKIERRLRNEGMLS